MSLLPSPEASESRWGFYSASSIALQIGGQLFGAVFLAGLVVAQFASGLAAQSPDEPGKAYNTLVAFGPDGQRLAFYRKIHLFDAQGFGESTFIKPGPSTSPVVFESGGARFGLMT